MEKGFPAVCCGGGGAGGGGAEATVWAGAGCVFVGMLFGAELLH